MVLVIVYHDVYIFAGAIAIGLGAPVHLGFDESPVITAHCHITQHYTRTRQLYQPWCAPIGAKRARIEELRQQNESEAKLAECARTAVITRSRSFS